MKKRLKVAKERIQEFKLLNSIFNNFNDYETGVSLGNDLPKNVIFNLFATDRHEGDQGSQSELVDLENAISHFFNPNSVTKTEYAEFVKRLTSTDIFESIEAYEEISIGYQIAKKIGFDKVNLHSKLPNGKKPDLLIDIGGIKTILELTGLTLRKSELKINEITAEITKYILYKCDKKGFLMSILVDVSSIISNDINGNIDVEKSVSVIHSKIDTLHLEDLVSFRGSIDFEGSVIKITENQVNTLPPLLPNNEKAIIWIDKNSKEESVFAAHHMKLVNTSEPVLGSIDFSLFENWAKKVLLKDFLNSPFESTSYFTNKNSCVYVNSIEFNSNDDNLRQSAKLQTSRAVKEGFLEQIRRSIEKKIKKGQFEKGYPFIIAIRADEWRFEYEFDYDDFVPLRNKVQNLLKNFGNISGVILFRRDIYLGRFIENSNAINPLREEDLEKRDILSKHHEPLITHDRIVDLGKLDPESKKRRIKEIIQMEPKFGLYKDTTFTPYASGDLEELFKELNEYLHEKDIERSLLDSIDPVIKKYSMLKSDKENMKEAEERDDPISEGNILLGGRIPIRAYAASCQILFTKHRPRSQNISLCLTLSEDPNTYVRMDVCNVLSTLYEISPNHALEIANRYCLDNKYVKWYLRGFLRVLVHKNKEEALNIFRTIIREDGKKRSSSQGENILLLDVVSIVTQLTLSNQRDYDILFNELLTNQEYDVDIKKRIITAMRNERFLLDPIILKRVLNYYMVLIEHDSFETKANVDFFLLYTLVERGTSLFPDIRKLIDTISKIEYPNPIIGLDNVYRFEILDYIHKFCPEFPLEASQFLINIIDRNSFLLKSVRAHTIVRILGILLENTEDKDTKMKLVCILKKIDGRIYWEVDQILDKLRKNDPNFADI